MSLCLGSLSGRIVGRKGVAACLGVKGVGRKVFQLASRGRDTG